MTTAALATGFGPGEVTTAALATGEGPGLATTAALAARECLIGMSDSFGFGRFVRLDGGDEGLGGDASVSYQLATGVTDG